MKSIEVCSDWEVTVETYWGETFTEYFCGVGSEKELDDATSVIREHWGLSKNDVTGVSMTECPNLLYERMEEEVQNNCYGPEGY